MHSVLETGYSRRALHVVDWDGDGNADIVAVDNNNFDLTVWINHWNGKSFNFEKQSLGGPYCTIRRGLGYNDQSVHIADITYVLIPPLSTLDLADSTHPVARARRT